MSATASSPPPAISDPKPSPAPAQLADIAEEPEAAQQPGVKQNDPDLGNAKMCDTCGSTGKRNLVVCIDGTSNQFSTKNTNVVELYSRLVKDEHQLTFYNSGIGTYAKPSWRSWDYGKQVIANMLDLAFALRFEKIIISAYSWLVDNYQPGDRIFLFGLQQNSPTALKDYQPCGAGFSRGAYQVRALAAMIDIVGLLHKGNTDQIPFAYELYAASGKKSQQHAEMAPFEDWSDIRPLRERISQAWKTRGSKGGEDSLPSFPWPTAPVGTDYPVWREDKITMQEQFKKTFSRERVRVHFVGAWDTVSSVGLIRDKTLPSTTDGMQCVCFFRHALALHEFRVKFLPEYVNGGAGPSPLSTYGSGDPHTKEVWFTGSHSDIGGGSSTNTSLDKFGPALRWMSWEATSAGLRLVPTPDNWEPIRVSQSMTDIWAIFECLPIKRLLYPAYEPLDGVPAGPSFTSLPHFFARRRIQPRQRIHQSVFEECLQFARPKNVMVEADAYLVLPPQAEVLRRGWIFNEERMLSLQQLTTSRDGIRSLDFFGVSKYIYDLARKCWDKPDETAKILADLMALNDASTNGPIHDTKSRNPQHVINVTQSSSATFPFRMTGHASLVSSVAFLSKMRLISGSWDRTLRLWDVSTGEMTLDSPSSGHSDAINCVAVHTAKGLVASASDDSTIHLWTSESNGAVHAGKVLQDGSRRPVLAVAFSRNGSHLVSGSRDGAIRVWDAATGRRVGDPVGGHTNRVRSIAFSSEGRRIVSGSDDRTVRLWEWSPDEATLQPSGEPLTGHTGWVLSVAFSQDTRIIASGSGDETVRIWDVATRTSIFTLKGHTNWVRSVAFAPSGTHVLSGSDDWTVGLWDARTGAAVRVFRGHTARVRSVTFSPDGTRIASGSDDKTVRVWDFVPPPNESHPDEDAPAVPAQIEPA